jgi:hypothetical protein
MRPLSLVLVAAVLTAACAEDAVSDVQGIGEPIVIESGQFLPGPLPGQPPIDASVDGSAAAGPSVADINVANAVISEGEQGLVLSGHATTNGQTLGVRFADLGSGYWVVPLGPPDPSDGNLLTWQVSADFARNLPPGFHDLLFTAIGAGGAGGVESELTVCVDTPVPDNLNICAPTRPPPAAVLSLSWNTPVDLELIVETPSGTMIGGSTAAAMTLDGGAVSTMVTSTGDAVLDRESNRNCVIDNIDRDDLVWQATPAAGTYQVWVDLFRACGQPAATFTVSLWLAETQSDGNERLVEQSPPLASGELTAAQANGGSSSGLFIGSFILK